MHTRALMAVVLGSAGAGIAVVAGAGARPVSVRTTTPTVGTGTGATGTVVTGTTVNPTTIPSGSGLPKAKPWQLTHPRVRPRIGGRRTIFMLSFTLRHDAGHKGILATDYRPQVFPPHPARARCAPTQPALVQTGTAGTVERIPLGPPARGWCRGRYRVTVYLQRGPYCPPPAYGQPPTPCPEFATMDLPVGTTHFSVR